MNTPDSIYMVFDVESIGLHGQAFAVAYTVVNGEGMTLEEACLSCNPDDCQGALDDRLWVQENIPNLPITHPDAESLRLDFWKVYISWKNKKATLVADCPWPVEARFLSTCVDDDFQARVWEGPYPLLDIASIQMGQGEDFALSSPRLPNELPVHHPLMDARQSARQLLELLKKVDNGKK